MNLVSHINKFGMDVGGVFYPPATTGMYLYYHTQHHYQGIHLMLTTRYMVNIKLKQEFLFAVFLKTESILDAIRVL